MAGPDARSIQVKWDRTRFSPVAHCSELIPSWQLASQGAIRQLQQDRPRLTMTSTPGISLHVERAASPIRHMDGLLLNVRGSSLGHEG